MLASYLLTLREGIEAALIIGVILGLLKKIEKEEMIPAVWAGAGTAAVTSILIGVLLNYLGASFEGAAEEAFEGIVMLGAAALLTWMIWWMYNQARTLNEKLKQDTALAARNSKFALFTVSFMAVVREGVELAIFLTAASYTSSAQDTLIGAGFGLLTSVILAWILFSGLVRLKLKNFFRVTGVLLILFAAGLVAHGVHEFNEAGVIPAVIEHIWDVNPILDENSTLGSMLKALFGYNGNPSLTEVLAYFTYFVSIFIGLRLSDRKKETTVQSQA